MMNRRIILKSFAFIGAISIIAVAVTVNRNQKVDPEMVQMNGWILKKGDF